MRKTVCSVLAFTICATTPIAASAADLPGTGADAGKTVVYRDTFGVPHIFAPTVEAGMYAMGWAQAEDRPEELLKNLLLAIGEFSSIAGPAALQSDIRSHMWDHYGVSKRLIDRVDPEVRKGNQAYAEGMNDFYAAHPDDLPAWWGSRTVDEFMVMAFGRLFLYNWSIDDAYGDLRRGGVAPGFDNPQRGSNQWAVSPSRSASGAAILYIDPHLSWWGPSRFWAVRIHAGEIEGSGVTLPGSPGIGLGHNANVAWAMTTGGPDTADIFELTLKEGDPTKYLFDGEFRDLKQRDVTIQVRGKGEETVTIWESHQGPIVAMRNGKAYAAAMAYAEEVEVTEAWRLLNTAKDYRGVMQGLESRQLFPQNVMVADTSGNIYYQRTGRVPKRPAGLDYSKPVDGSTSATAWQGVHPASDHVQLLNPPQGYMQNCNIPPDAMLVGSPLTKDKYADYLYGSSGGSTNQRGARAVELLSQDDSVTIEEALTYAVDVHPAGVERWIEVLKMADEQFGESLRSNSDYVQGIDDVLAWDQQLRADSSGALKYFYWRQQLVEDYGNDVVRDAASRINFLFHPVVGQPIPEIDLSAEELQAAIGSFENAMTRLKEDMGSLAAVYGDKFRVGRDDKSWPLGGGGGRTGTTTLRNIGYDNEREDKTRWGRSGQTSTQICVMTKPVQSWMYLPLAKAIAPIRHTTRATRKRRSASANSSRPGGNRRIWRTTSNRGRCSPTRRRERSREFPFRPRWLASCLCGQVLHGADRCKSSRKGAKKRAQILAPKNRGTRVPPRG